MAKLTKKQKLAAEKIEAGKLYTIEEAAALVKEITTTKFDASVDIDVRLGVDPRKANQMVRGVVALPNGTGKTVRVLALCMPDQEAAAKEAGADFVKTSTGFSKGGATVEAVSLMRKTVGADMGVKASGGIRDYKTAKAMIEAGASRIGASAGIAIVEAEKAEKGE